MMMKNTLRRVAFYVVLIAIWELVVRMRFWPEYLFPSPAEVVQVLGGGIADGTLLKGVAVSGRRIAEGYLLSLVVGVVLGLMLARLKIFEDIVGPILLGLRSLPSICWLPLGMLWFGLSEKAILFVVLMGATFAVALATSDGVKNVPPVYLQAASTMGVTGPRSFVRVTLPSALPSIVTGMKLGWAFAWRSLMAAEMVFVTLGLGHLLMMGRELNDMARVIAAMIVIVAFGMLVDRVVFMTLESRVRERWGLDVA
jgi:NitT/TauT family transport system permease protein